MRSGLTARRSFAILVPLALVLSPAAARGAADRYASPDVADVPGPHAPLPCTQSDPCSFKDAWEGAADGDTVIVLPGDYDVSSSGAIDKQLTIRGAAGEAVPHLHSGGAQALRLENQIDLQRLSIEETGTVGPGLFVGGDADGSSIRQVVTRSSGTQGCLIQDAASVTVSDSVCMSSSVNSQALAVFFQDGTAGTVNLRNVTARSTAAGSHGVVAAAMNVGSIATVIAHNVIAHGEASDARASANTSGQSSLTLDRSNYATELEQGGLVTDPGTGDNQTAAPALDADGYHELAGSPTIDAGSAAPPLGTADVDGEARTTGSAPDIGADEYQPPPVVNPPPPNSPTGNPPTRFCHGIKATLIAGGGLTKGTEKRDIVVGTTGPNTIKALGGNDLVCGAGGKDRVYGGAGKDRLLGQAGADKLYGQAGRDQLLGGTGRDLLVGGAGRDALLGGPAKDVTEQ
jgi:hemolysin type calcium-binding protein